MAGWAVVQNPVAPEAAWKAERVLTDLELTSQLGKKLDGEKGIGGAPAAEEAKPAAADAVDPAPGPECLMSNSSTKDLPDADLQLLSARDVSQTAREASHSNITNPCFRSAEPSSTVYAIKSMASQSKCKPGIDAFKRAVADLCR